MFQIYCTGQGSTNLPTIWLINSSTLFDIHEELSNRAIFSDTIQEIEVHITLVGFIEDVTGQTNDFYNENVTPEELIHLMQEDAQDGTPVVQSTRPGPPLVVKQSNNKTNTEIQYKSLYTPHTILGHQKALCGGN
eukprot:13894224-Ditylum_brightwellii.AAC.1